MRRFRTARVLLAATLVSTAAVAGVGSSSVAAAAPSAVQRLAPYVYLYSDDGDRPDSAAVFLAHSRLRWSHDAGCPDDGIADTGTVDAARLGDGRYPSEQVESTLPSCTKHGGSFRTTDDTRPYSGDAGQEGYFLDLTNADRHGLAAGTAPVYYQYRRHAYVTYWFLYGNNDFPIASAFDHEGDWERISIQLDVQDHPVRVAYYEHSGYCTLPWSATPTRSGRPVTFSAQGSHADYPSAGAHTIYPGVSDHTDRGPLWNTAVHLAPVTAQSWYGYGGGWGEVGATELSTGPQGPSSYKGAAPTDWTADPCDG